MVNTHNYIIESVIPLEPKLFDLLCCRLASESTPAVYVCTPLCQLRLQAQTFQTPALAAFDIEVGANSCFPELLLAVATVDVACRNGTLATGAGKGVYFRAGQQTVEDVAGPCSERVNN